jgi:hypothetical protein
MHLVAKSKSAVARFSPFLGIWAVSLTSTNMLIANGINAQCSTWNITAKRWGAGSQGPGAGSFSSPASDSRPPTPRVAPKKRREAKNLRSPWNIFQKAQEKMKVPSRVTFIYVSENNRQWTIENPYRRREFFFPGH